MLATTTPYDLVKPLADALGFDDVVATRYGVKDGVYDGTLDGEFVWGPGKLRAIAEWAMENAIDLGESWAYSDSYYDIPMLVRRGAPGRGEPRPAHARHRARAAVAGRPPRRAGRRAEAARAQRRAAARAPRAGPARARSRTRASTSPASSTCPKEGAAIVVGNHRSYFDPMAMGLALAKRGRPVRFLGKKEVFDAPIVGQLARAMGGIRVERGTGSDEPLAEAALALEAGELVAMMPEGTIPRGKAFFDPVLKGRWGAARLAAMTGAPVIPVGLWGTEKVWPRSERLPNVLAAPQPAHGHDPDRSARWRASPAHHPTPTPRRS